MGGPSIDRREQERDPRHSLFSGATQWMASALAVGLISTGCAFGTDEPGSKIPDLAALHLAFEHQISEVQEPGDQANLRTLAHQTRNASAFHDLAEQLPADTKPSRILYLASGSHVAPLAICDALPDATPCSLELTEIDPDVQQELESFFAAARANGYLHSVKDTGPLTTSSGIRTWRFQAGARPVSLTLRINDPSTETNDAGLIDPAALEGIDLVISHDWSGDPFGNLDVIRQLVSASRAAGLIHPPALMIEDIANHPYPVDLSFFSVVARTTKAYGHRGSDAGLGRHGSIELGEPIFGGGVVLAFDEPWLRWVDDSTFSSFLDFLLLDRFDVDRRNVLENGAAPLLAPALLDWWSGFGSRTMAGGDLSQTPELRRPAIEAATSVAGLLTGDSRAHLSCRLELYRALLAARAAGEDVRPVLPPSMGARTLGPGEFPSPEMGKQYREALRHTGDYRTERERDNKIAGQLLELFESEEVKTLLAACPCALPEDEQSAPWTQRYKGILDCLNKSP